MFGGCFRMFANALGMFGDVWGCLCPNWPHAGSKCSTSTQTAYTLRGRAAVVEASTNPEHVKPFAKHFALETQHSPNKCLWFALCFKFVSIIGEKHGQNQEKRRPSTYAEGACQRSGDNIVQQDHDDETSWRPSGCRHHTPFFFCSTQTAESKARVSPKAIKRNPRFVAHYCVQAMFGKCRGWFWCVWGCLGMCVDDWWCLGKAGMYGDYHIWFAHFIHLRHYFVPHAYSCTSKRSLLSSCLMATASSQTSVS